MSWPQIIAVPAVGARNPVIIFIVVDLPAPLGPRKPSTSPAGTLNEISSTAIRGPKFLTRLQISSISPSPEGRLFSLFAPANPPRPKRATQVTDDTEAVRELRA